MESIRSVVSNSFGAMSVEVDSGIESLDAYYELINDIEENATTMGYPLERNVIRAVSFLDHRLDGFIRADDLTYRNLSLIKYHLEFLGIRCERDERMFEEHSKAFSDKIEMHMDALMPRLLEEPRFISLPESIVSFAVNRILEVGDKIDEVVYQLGKIHVATTVYPASILGYNERERGLLRDSFHVFVLSKIFPVYEKIRGEELPKSVDRLQERSLEEGALQNFDKMIYLIVKEVSHPVDHKDLSYSKIELLYFTITMGGHPSIRDFDEAIPYLGERLEAIEVKGDILELRELRGFRYFFDQYIKRREMFSYPLPEDAQHIYQRLLVRIEGLQLKIRAPEDEIKGVLEEIRHKLPDLKAVDIKTGRSSKQFTRMQLEEMIYPDLERIEFCFKAFKESLTVQTPTEKMFLVTSLRAIFFKEICMTYTRWMGISLTIDMPLFKEEIVNALRQKGPKSLVTIRAIRVLHALFFQLDS